MYNSPNALLKGIKAEFANMLNSAPNNTFDFATFKTKSNTNEEKYWIPESMPGLYEWIDERHFGDFLDNNYTVTNKHYESGLSVDRDTIDDSREYLGGNVEMWIKTLVNSYKDFPDQLIEADIEANGNAWDGEAFFKTSRSLDTGGNTINNLATGTSSTTYSFAEFEADFVANKTKLLGFRDKNNRALNKGAKLAVLVPRHLEDLAQKLLTARADRVYDGTAEKSNIYAGAAEVYVNWEQTSSSNNDWYLINTSAPFKPFLIQDRKGVQWDMFDDKMLKDIKYGMDFRMGSALLNFFSIIKINN
jgi:phage major head subunit gpT-like protein